MNSFNRSALASPTSPPPPSSSSLHHQSSLSTAAHGSKTQQQLHNQPKSVTSFPYPSIKVTSSGSSTSSAIVSVTSNSSIVDEPLIVYPGAISSMLHLLTAIRITSANENVRFIVFVLVVVLLVFLSLI